MLPTLSVLPVETAAQEPLSAQFDALIETFQGRNVDLCPGAPGLRITFHGEGGYTHFAPVLVALPASWEGYGSLQLRGTTEQAGTFLLQVLGPTAMLEQSFTLKPGEPVMLTLPLDELPLINPASNPFAPTEVRMLCEQAWQVHIEELTLIPREEIAPACIDAFGQRRLADWEGKVASIEDLQAARTEEAEALEKFTPPHPRAASGGWTKGARFPAAGFFKLGRTVQNRWWLIDPEGHPFWALGVSRSGFGGCSTEVDARPFLFEAPPDNGDYLERNLRQKYGSHEVWGTHLHQRYQSMGLTCVGPGTPLEDAKALGLPYFASLEIGEAFSEGGLADIFQADFPERLQAYVKDQLERMGKEPACIGYLADTVAAWHQHHFLEAPAESELKAAFEAHIRERYKGKLEKFAESWNVAVSDWSELRRLRPESASEHSARVRQDCESFTAHYAERYLQLTAEAFATSDPDRLYCGCVFGPELPGAGFMTLAGKFCDIVLLRNGEEIYDKQTLDQIHEWSGRPLLLVGMGWPENSARSLPGSNPRYAPESIANAMTKAIREAAFRPYLLGWMLENAYDSSASGRSADGSTTATGLMDITDQARPALGEALRAASRDIYTWHLQS